MAHRMGLLMKHHGTAEGETRQVPEVERLGNLRQVPLLQRLGLGSLVVVVAGEEDEVVRLAMPATPRFPAILPFSMASLTTKMIRDRR
mmetsp:Transcript_31764/g.51342  ORF Transcript_31764/g.51342 Transcript_31764/m.51342 type:complete len:88 (+) Transcript_31764:281-544(+)